MYTQKDVYRRLRYIIHDLNKNVIMSIRYYSPTTKNYKFKITYLILRVSIHAIVCFDRVDAFVLGMFDENLNQT